MLAMDMENFSGGSREVSWNVQISRRKMGGGLDHGVVILMERNGGFGLCFSWRVNEAL